MALFKKLQASIMQLWTELDVEPQTDVEQMLCQEDADERFIISSDNLDLLTDLQKKVCVVF